MADYLLPDVGEGLTEAEIVAWRVKEGDTVQINDIVVEIETAKSLVELPSPYAGVVTALLVPEGETVPVGTAIISIGDPSEKPAGAPAPADIGEIDLSNPAASGGGEGESLVGRNKADRGPIRRPRKGLASPTTEAAAATQMQLQGAFAPGGAQSQAVVESDEPAVPAHTVTDEPAPVGDARALAKPPVRKLAKDLGVDLSTVTATGPNGSISREDVQAAVGSTRTSYESAAVATTSYDAAERERREPIKGVRKMMGQAMVDSAFSAPHVTEWVTIDVTRTMEFVERLKSRREFRDVKVSPLLVLARACMLAMRRTPEINSFWDEPAQEIVFKSYVNLGIAAATPRGLVVPNIKDAERLSLLELAGALNQLAATAREGKTQPAEMSGGSFTITNVGVFGVDAGTPIINPGESAILCFGAVKKQPWVVSTDSGEEIVVRQVTQLALSFDHRHVDGEKGSRFLSDVAAIMEDPAAALLF
ncbi:dihydrolipoamide acetyltransferase family protein [Marmoricola sp. URHB0036]|uniref:dihydrolipoamide acetyltransferase family protein n=1 Tax=Marmoricola sp. URHB0036 TaxID=1298863 RepID=UPI000429DC7B|nr:dihydrolipoamide acetyltransferase family protein [Marmoricola sp. URHB0036]